jgi:hypothetical protein
LTSLGMAQSKLGFSTIWVSWTKMILDSASSFILLNGVSGKNFQFRRGLRQGDPLSPLLFVLSAELLQYVINKACALGLLQAPLNLSYTNDYPVIQYADDTILVMRASHRELFTLKGLLQTYNQSTGLRVNYGKSCLLSLPIKI